MKKLSKMFLIALCALTTAFFAVACGESNSSGTDSTTGGTSLDTSVDSSEDETSSDDSSDDSEDSSSEDEPDLFGITVNAAEGLTVDGTTTVTGGEAYSFRVSVATGYQKTDAFAVTVTMGGQAVTLVQEDDTYTIENVTGEIVITVVGVEKQTFAVTASAVDGVNVELVETVAFGESYSFTVSVATGYQKTDVFAVTATMSGAEVTLVEEDGEYTIANVTGDVVITVVGVEKKTFNVTKPETLGVTLEGADSVVFGENYTFTVSFADGYKAGEAFAVSVNGKTVTANESGTYTVENVKSGLVIVVEGVEEVQYTATFTSNYADALKNQQEGFKYEAENYTFKVELSEKYTQCADSIAVFYKVEGNTEEIAINPDGEGVYTIANPKANVEIIVKNVALNEYKVTFQRNAVVKYETVGLAGEALTQEQIDAALVALLGENEEFVAWREDITSPIMDDVTFSVVTRAKEAWGELIEGNPLKDGAVQEGEYSAAGYEKVYAKANFATAPFAEIDLSAYETVKFAFKHEKSWVLFDGWTYYIDCRNTWIDVSMERTVAGDWNVTIEAPVNHNSSEGATVVNPYKATLTGNTLSAIFANWTNESAAADLYVTELRGEKPSYTKVADSAMSGTTATSETAPAGFTTVSERTIAEADKGSVFADVNIATYAEVKFAFKSSSWMLLGGWAEYVHTPNNWVNVQLINNFDNSWQVNIYATVQVNFVASADNPYVLTANGQTLKDILANWYNDAGNTFYITELLGIQGEIPENELYGTEIVEQAIAGSTATTAVSSPEGFEKAYEYAKIPANTTFADVDISGYSEVKFNMWLEKGYICIISWGAYAENAGWGKQWVPITLTNNENGGWTITIEALIAGANKNPYTYTASGKKLSEVLATWFDFVSDSATIYVTEIRGMAKEEAEPIIWGSVVDASLLTSQYVTLDETAKAPDGFETVYAVNGVTNKDKMSTIDLSEYSEIRFAVKSTKYFLIKGWAVYFRESYTDWANVVMVNNNDGTWTVTIYGDVYTGSAYENPYTVTYTGNSIATILSAWQTDEQAVTYVTEIRGVKA